MPARGIIPPREPSLVARPLPTSLDASTSPARSMVVVEGGAMRGVFALGVVCGFVEGGNASLFPFDACLGVSSGAFALALFLLGRADVALAALTEWAVRDDFISFRRFVRGGHLLDLDRLSGEVAGALGPPGRWRWRAPLEVCITDVATGGPRYLTATADNLLSLLHATTAMPWLYRRFPEVDGRPSTDGGASDAIPLQRALELGATRVMVVRARPRAHVKRDTVAHRLVRWKLRHHEPLVAAMRGRAERFARVMTLMRDPPPPVRVLEVCPPASFSMGRFGRDRRALLTGYAAGLEEGRAAARLWTSTITNDDAETAG